MHPLVWLHRWPEADMKNRCDGCLKKDGEQHDHDCSRFGLVVTSKPL